MTKINTKALQEALKVSANTVIKTHNPIFSHVHLITNKVTNRVLLSTTDLTQYLTVSIPAEIEENLETVIPFAKLQNIVRLAGKKDTITTISAKDEKTTVATVGRGSYPLEALPADDFPRGPAFPHANEKVRTLEAKPFIELLNRLAPAVSSDEMRKNLSGICFDGRFGRNEIAATDGHRLHVEPFEALTDSDVMMPKVSVKTLNNLLKTNDKFSLGFTEKFITVESHNATTGLSCFYQVEAVKADFPDYKQIMPNPSESVEVSHAELEESVKRMLKLSGDCYTDIELNGSFDLVGLDKAREILSSSKTFPKVHKFGFNMNFLLDILKVTKGGETVRFSFTPLGENGYSNRYAPAIFEVPGFEMKAVVMPMELDKTR